ncbi:MAG: hypothetical protein PHD21_04705 [Flavobacteriales bacterium]|nr:hypothetical protein [Flavobacteriales bacterium]
MNNNIDQLLLVIIISASVIGLLVIALRKIKRIGKCCDGEKDCCSHCEDCPLVDNCKKKH